MWKYSIRFHWTVLFQPIPVLPSYEVMDLYSIPILNSSWFPYISMWIKARIHRKALHKALNTLMLLASVTTRGTLVNRLLSDGPEISQN